MRFKRLLTLVGVLALIAAACGGTDQVEVKDVWARASASMQNAGAVYMTITGGDKADQLVGVSVSPDVAAQAQVHETVMDPDTPGAMKMQEVAAIDIPAGGEVTLAPGGYHIMLMMLAEPLVVGGEIEVTLQFAEAGDVKVTAEIREN